MLLTTAVFALFAVLLCGQCDSARILGLFTSPAKSHLIIHTAVTDALAARGHDITIVTTIPLIKKNPLYRHVQLDAPAFSREFFTKTINNAEPFYKQLSSITRMANICNNATLQHPSLQRLMQEETFDLVIFGYFFNDFQLGVAAHFKCPVVISFMVQPPRQLNEFIGNPMELAIVPHIFTGAKQPMKFWHRVKNILIVEVFERILIRMHVTNQQETLYNSELVLNRIGRPVMLLETAFLTLFAVLLCGQCESARILGLFTSPAKSHLIINTAITDALAAHGHDVTVVTTIPLIKKNPLYRHIQIDAPPFSREFFIKTIHNAEPFYKQFGTITRMVNICNNATLQHATFQKLMQEETFDLMVLGYYFNDFQLGVAVHFKCPVVLAFLIQPVRQLNDLIGNPIEVATVPNLFTGVKQPMTFWDRVKNLLMVEVFERFIIRIHTAKQQEILYNYNFPPEKYPSLEEVKKNISLVLTNHHFSQGPIRPNVPAMVEIGGIQIKDKPDPLPEDLKAILDNAKHGVVYVSFGSNVQGNILDKAKNKAMFDVLSKLSQTILWKWGETDFPGQSPNIVYKTWLPQDDILAHPNVKLFVTHGGQGSVVESEYHGVPMVVVPLFAEQHVNAAHVVSSGYGQMADFTTISVESFGEAVHEVLSNNRYRDNVRQFARLYKDRPMTAKETAVFWVEYVLRHRGAPHMQSPAVHLNRWQLLSLDVIGFLLVVVYLVFKVIKVSVSFICCRKSSKEKRKSE